MKSGSTIGFVAALGIALFSLGLTLYLGHDGQLKLETFISVAGLLITVIAFAFGCLFAVFAVSAYAQVREIEQRRDVIEKLQPRLEIAASEAQDVSRAMVVLMFEMYSEQLYRPKLGADVSPNKRDQRAQRQDELLRARALLSVRYKTLDPTQRMASVRELITCGKAEDRADLLRLIKDPQESPELVALARTVRDAISVRDDAREK